MSTTVPASLSPRQSRLLRTTLILAFLGALTFASVAAKSVIDDRCGTKDQYLRNSADLVIHNELGQPITVGQAYECRLSEAWTLHFREGFPYIRFEYDRLPEFARPL